MSRIPKKGKIQPISGEVEYRSEPRPTAKTNKRHIPVPVRIFRARSAGVIVASWMPKGIKPTLSIRFAHQFVNLVRKESTIYRRHFKNAAIVSSSDVLQQGMATFFMEGKKCWLINLLSVSYAVDEGFRFHGKLANLVDHNYFAIIDCMLDCRDSDSFEFCSVQSIS